MINTNNINNVINKHFIFGLAIESGITFGNKFVEPVSPGGVASFIYSPHMDWLHQFHMDRFRFGGGYDGFIGGGGCGCAIATGNGCVCGCNTAVFLFSYWLWQLNRTA
ncbi:hypothetical protein DERP_008339 [Dermatophagoides pteronyssinus]|uniref:Uncharacterized protein n=1 Tax=Dermatophagoides pteronyssinus TaxID=6956 RepID=A0ABQ8J6C1_DERPT|nr:hypothetical protein DERP_008339 [Dermatophagoides pteronyssinus]